MISKRSHRGQFIFILLVLLAACSSSGGSQKNGTPPVISLDPTATTSAAIQITYLPPRSATSLKPQPSETPRLAATVIPLTPSPTVTAHPQVNAAERLTCDYASLVADITVQAGTSIPAGTQFIKTWRVKNTGTCTWTPDYAIVFDAGDPMKGPDIQKLDVAVPPGETVDISLVLEAPGQPGEGQSQWKLRNAAGTIFGWGTAQDQPLIVDITVQPAPAVGLGYDFIANDCQAEWFSNNRATACLGTDGDPNGFILTKMHPILESGYIDDQPALLMSPPINSGGFIYGRYPVFTVQANDHFVSIIGCEHNAKNCNVRFRLDYQIDNNPVQTLAAWNQVYDGKFASIDVDLTSLAGKNVQFILTVIANGESDQNRALWLLPRILR